MSCYHAMRKFLTWVCGYDKKQLTATVHRHPEHDHTSNDHLWREHKQSFFLMFSFLMWVKVDRLILIFLQNYLSLIIKHSLIYGRYTWWVCFRVACFPSSMKWKLFGVKFQMIDSESWPSLLDTRWPVDLNSDPSVTTNPYYGCSMQIAGNDWDCFQ